MKFVFNDSLTASVVSETDSETSNKFVSSNIILEKRIVTATIRDMNDLFTKLNTLTSNTDKTNFLESSEVKSFLAIGDNNKRFLERLMKDQSISSSSKNNSLQSYLLEQAQEGALMAEDPTSKFAPFMETKDAILARLDGVMSRENAAEIFYKLEEKVKLSYTETIGLVDYCLNKSRSCSANVADILNFFIEHYGQKRQYSRTKNIIDVACEYQKLNPTIDIFSVLRDATAGNQPKVNLGYLSKDPQDQLIFNNLIFLSQSNMPEQTEEIRRRTQESRDALDAQVQKVNMQRAIFDMMKIEESNNQLERMVNNLGEAFKFLLTQPMYRALRGMYYDLRASKILLNQASSIFAGDTSPEQKRNKPSEDMYFNTAPQFPGIPDSRTPFSNSDFKFLKLASPETTRYIYSQTTPNVSQENKMSALSIFREIYDAIGGKYSEVVEKLTNLVTGNPVANKIRNFYLALSSGILAIINAIQSNKLTAQIVNEQFKKIEESLQDDVDNVIASPNNKFVKIAQLNPQQGPVQVGGNITGVVNKVLGILNGIGGIFIGYFSIKSAVDKIKLEDLLKGNWIKAGQAILPAILYMKNIITETLMQFEFFGRNAPQSNIFYDNNGQLTDRGKQILVNQQETLIAAGIADQDANALAKFAVQSGYLMQQLVTKEENLKNSEQQIVQLGGGKTDYTVGDLPVDFKKKVKEFLDFCTEVEFQYKAAINIFKNAFRSINPNFLNNVQKTQMTGLLAKYEKDLIDVQRKRAEWSSMKNIADHLIRKRILLQKLKPLQTQMDTLKKLGIPISEIIASPNGIISQVGAIRYEVYQALVKARKEYYELSQLLTNPDTTAKMVQYPTDTGVTKLPESQFQEPSEASPFDVPSDSQFNEAPAR